MERNSAFPLEGIASCSKYLSVKRPEWARIYDARICFSLNALLYLYKVDSHSWKITKSKGEFTGFGGASRNSRIQICEEYVMAQNIMRHKEVVNRSRCYDE
jgi:hypothetical protein